MAKNPFPVLFKSVFKLTYRRHGMVKTASHVPSHYQPPITAARSAQDWQITNWPSSSGHWQLLQVNLPQAGQTAIADVSAKSWQLEHGTISTLVCFSFIPFNSPDTVTIYRRHRMAKKRSLIRSHMVATSSARAGSNHLICVVSRLDPKAIPPYPCCLSR